MQRKAKDSRTETCVVEVIELWQVQRRGDQGLPMKRRLSAEDDSVLCQRNFLEDQTRWNQEREKKADIISGY